MTFWVWCEVLCSECNKQLCGDFTTHRIPRARFSTELANMNAIIDKKEVFCSEKCKERFAQRKFTKEDAEVYAVRK